MDKKKQIDLVTKPKKKFLYKMFFPVVKFFFKRQTVLYKQPVPHDEPVIFVANHAQAFGPMSMIINFDKEVRPWIAADIMFKETAADFAFIQFFAGNIKKHKRWNMFKSKIVGRFLVWIFSNVGGIPVYYDRRLVNTMSISVDVLKNGENLVIFGETPQRFSPYVAQISEGFVQIANIYYKQTGKHLKFYPVYIAPKYITVGEPTAFDSTVPVKEERKRVAEYLRDNIDLLARELPPFEPIVTYTEEYYQAVEKRDADKLAEQEARREQKQQEESQQEHNQ